MCSTHASDFCFSDDLCCIAFNRNYTYDALGNLIYRQLPNGENQYYKYDLENQLVHAEIKKAANKPITSTATKSASHARLPIRTAIWFWDGQTEERNQRNGCRCIIGKRYMYRKMPGRKKRKKCLDATVDNIKMVTAKTSYLTLQKGVSIPAVARYNQTL